MILLSTGTLINENEIELIYIIEPTIQTYNLKIAKLYYKNIDTLISFTLQIKEYNELIKKLKEKGMIDKIKKMKE